ncbi:hypothetical protein B0H12DRAFT_1151820, partial [Mycena haematopus]
MPPLPRLSIPGPSAQGRTVNPPRQSRISIDCGVQMPPHARMQRLASSSSLSLDGDRSRAPRISRRRSVHMKKRATLLGTRTRWQHMHAKGHGSGQDNPRLQEHKGQNEREEDGTEGEGEGFKIPRTAPAMNAVVQRVGGPFTSKGWAIRGRRTHLL